jgi:predicted Zn-dependent peptidase
MKITKGNLPNTKMKYVTVDTNSGNRIKASILVNVGSRDETHSINGISHCLEHMFFKGSKNYPEFKELDKEIYKCDGFINAYTTKDSTVFYIDCSKKCVEKAVYILSDMFYNSLFKEKDLDIEKNVIYNELKQGKTDIGLVTSYKLEQLCYKNTRLELQPIGIKSSIQKITCDDLKNFINTYYKKNVIISISGNISNKHAQSLLKKYFKTTCHYPVKKNLYITKDHKRLLYNDFLFNQSKFKLKYIHNDTEQQYIELIFPSYKYSDDRWYIILFINELLTGYNGSILNKSLRDDRGLVYSIYTWREALKDMGSFRVSFSTQGDILECLQLIFKELNKLKHTVHSELMENVRCNLLENIRNDIDRYSELGVMYSYDLYHLNNIPTIDSKIKKYKQITIKDINEIAKEIFVVSKCSLCYSSKKNSNKSIYKLMRSLQDNTHKQIKTIKK